MLQTQPLHKSDNIQYDYLKCPACKKGRLCDKPAGEKVKTRSTPDGISLDQGNWLILKCPNCSQKFAVSFTKE